MQRLMLKLGKEPELRIWRQNVGSIPILGSSQDGIRIGPGGVWIDPLYKAPSRKAQRFFHAGPPKGAADLSGIVSPEGWRVEIEVKGPKKKQSPQQKNWQAMIEKRGGIYVLAVYDEKLSKEDNVELVREELFKRINSRR